MSSGPFGDGSDGSTPAYLHALLEQTADSMENLQRIMARSEESRISTNTTLAGLTDRLGLLGDNLKAGQVLMVRLAENQLERNPALIRLASIAPTPLAPDTVLRPPCPNH